MGELTFLELRSKEIINGVDGRRLGRIIDIVFGDAGKVKGIVAPYCRRGFFTKSQDVYIPWSCIKKIGEDVILVEVDEIGHPRDNRMPPPPPPHDCPPPHPKDDCDGRCEKCMLFDCAYRWRDKCNRHD